MGTLIITRLSATFAMVPGTFLEFNTINEVDFTDLPVFAKEQLIHLLHFFIPGSDLFGLVGVTMYMALMRNYLILFCLLRAITKVNKVLQCFLTSVTDTIHCTVDSWIL